jgi:hypothetical protein
VKPVGALKKWHRGRYLDVGRRGKPKERTQGYGGSRKKLAAGRRGMTRREGVARHNGRGRQGHGSDNVAPRTQKRPTFGRRRRAHPECDRGIRNRDFKEQLRLGSKRTSARIYRKAFVLEIVKRAVRISSGLRKVRDWTLWRGRPPPNGKRDCTRSKSRQCGSTGHSR